MIFHSTNKINLLNFIILISALILVFSFSLESFAKSVRVRGYIRKNGTYVAPHYRSAPDGFFYNNWSTKGNINPYTGKDGAKLTPSSRYNRYSLPSIPNLNNIYKSTEKQNSDIFPSFPASNRNLTNHISNMDIELRKTTAKRLKANGHEVDWKNHSFLEMIDWENRISIAKRLKANGHEVDWKNHSFLEMIDWDNRISIAKRLKTKGYEVDWKNHSFLEMIIMDRE